MFSTDFIFRQQENLDDNQKLQAGFRPLCNKILFPTLCARTKTKALRIISLASTYIGKTQTFCLLFLLQLQKN